MRLSREKMVHLSHYVVQTLEGSSKVRFTEATNDVRLSIFNSILKFMKLDERIEGDVRKKMQSTKREMPEGSRDWEIQFRKYYEEEWDKMRKVKD